MSSVWTRSNSNSSKPILTRLDLPAPHSHHITSSRKNLPTFPPLVSLFSQILVTRTKHIYFPSKFIHLISWWPCPCFKLTSFTRKRLNSIVVNKKKKKKKISDAVTYHFQSIILNDEGRESVWDKAKKKRAREVRIGPRRKGWTEQ